MLQDRSRNRTPMPGAQAPGAAPPDTGPARAEAGIAALLAAPEPAGADPIFAAIAASRHRYADWMGAYDAWPHDKIEPPEVLARMNGGCHDFTDHLEATVLATVPTSIRGLASLGRYMIEVLNRDEVDVEKCAKAALETITEGLKALPVKPAAVPRGRQLAEVSLARMVVDYFGNEGIHPGLDGDIALRDRARAILAASGQTAVPATAEASAPTGPFHALISAHHVAYAEWDRLFQIASNLRRGGPGFDAAEAAAMAADRASEQAWRDLFRSRPQDLHELWLLLTHIEQYHSAHHDMTDAPDIWGKLTGAVAAIRTASKAPKVIPHDLSKLTVVQLSVLYEVCRQQREILLASEERSVCRGPNGRSTLGAITEAEGERFGFLAEDVVTEIERRKPNGESEQDLILEARVRHYMICGETFDAELLAEIAATWGAK